ncbi:MAG TPA: histidinol-phosphatase [Gaiellaceae bacterium]|nr:histidinol-phosphatase [Gaiellaceae bacterium]
MARICGLIVDYHMHLRAPDGSIDHSVEAVEPFVEVAASRGVDELGFTEHVYYFRDTRPLWSFPYHVERCVYALDVYVDAVVEAKRKGMPVKLGLEVDYVPGREAETAELLRGYPWDYLLGSVHYLGDHSIDAEPSLVGAVGTEEAWRRYYRALTNAAHSGLFDVLAHPDLVKMHGGEIAWAWDDVVAGLDGVCLEVSSSGLHKPHGKLYPNGDLLAAARRRDVPITLASDAHEPQNVGRDVDRAIEHARAAGYDTITVFEGRNARQEPLG